jgi:hypothetical protein
LGDISVAAVGNIEAASLEDNGGRVKDTVDFPLTFRTYSYRLFIKPLPFFKTGAAAITLIFIGGHLLHLADTYITISLVILQE